MGMTWHGGLRALIKDRHIRDCLGLGLLNIAFFAKELNPNGPYKNGLGCTRMTLEYKALA